MVFRRAIDAETRAYVRFLAEIQERSRQDIAKKFHISSASVSRILSGAKHSLNSIVRPTKSRPVGRPRKLTPRQERLLFRKIEFLRRKEGSFTVKRLMCEAGVDVRAVSCKTVRRFLHRNGYKYTQARRKGILKHMDQQKRLQFARKIKRMYSRTLWSEQIAFYLDGVSFVHKYNPADQARAPRGRIWRKAEEGLAVGCTAKASNGGAGGRMAKFMVAISYGEGVVLCEQYSKLDGQYFRGLIERKFLDIFQKANKGDSKLWVQDGDTSQNSALARSAWLAVGAELLAIPPRSPDINPIENIFHLVKGRLTKDALDRNITHEKFEDFSERVRSTILNMDRGVIDKTIASMDKRMDIIISKKGGRTRY